MSLHEELSAFYQRSGFGEVVGARPCTVKVYTGCMLVPMPNIEARRRYLKYHDLHHLITGYGVGRIGEGEVSAWELGTGSMFVSPTLGLMNLIALSTGLVLQPGRMWRAYQRGRKSWNLYPPGIRTKVDAGRWQDVASLRTAFLEVRAPAVPTVVQAVPFACYSAMAALIHATIAGPAVIIRFVTDISLGYSFFQAIQPKKRLDLY
jgi:hypothetical protein